MTQSIIGALRVVLGLDSATFVSGANAAEARMESMRRRMQRVGAQMQRVGGMMTLGITLPLIGVGRAALTAARESEQASAAVQAALTSMGDGAGFSLEDLQAQAEALANTTLFQDDQILTGVTANLLTFGNISGDVFERAQQSALDLSARLGTDLQGSAIMLGKALNDPIRGLSALTRVGVAFTDQQREQVRAMQEAGDMAGAQAIILDEVLRQVGGQAAAQANTDAGQITMAWNQIGEALEKVGLIILPVMAEMATHVTAAAQWFQELNPDIQEFIVGTGLIAAALGPAVLVMGQMAIAVAALGWPVTLIVVGLALLTAAVIQNWEAIKAWVEGAIQGAADMIAGIVQAFQDGVAYIGQKIEDIWTAIVEKITGWVTGFYDLGVNMITALRQGIQDTVTGLFIDLDQVGRSVADSIGGSMGLSIDMGSVGVDAANGVVLGVDGQLPWIRESGAAIGDALTEGARDRLDIRSPSEVFAEIGRLVMDGLGLGIENGIPGVRGQMNVATQDVVDAADGMADRVGQRFSDMGSWMVDLAKGATTLSETLENAARGWSRSLMNSGITELGSALTGSLGQVGGGLLSGILGNLLGGLIGANAGGTDFWRGGLTSVNERGGEIMNLPRGTQIIPHDVSMRLAKEAGSGGGTVRVIIEEAPGFAARVRTEAQGVAVQVVRRAAPGIVGDAVGAVYRANSEVKLA